MAKRNMRAVHEHRRDHIGVTPGSREHKKALAQLKAHDSKGNDEGRAPHPWMLAKRERRQPVEAIAAAKNNACYLPRKGSNFQPPDVQSSEMRITVRRASQLRHGGFNLELSGNYLMKALEIIL